MEMIEVRNAGAILHCNEVFIMKPNYEYLNASDLDQHSTDWSNSHIWLMSIHCAGGYSTHILTLHWVDRLSLRNEDACCIKAALSVQIIKKLKN